MIVGNTAKPYYSCAKLYIRGGNPNFNCRENRPILTYSCMVNQIKLENDPREGNIKLYRQKND